MRSALRRPALRTILFLGAAAAVVIANVVVAWHSIVVAPLWEDEAYNLTVPLNLVRGLGYTSDGILSGGQLMPFDVRISTGPVVLLPVAPLIAAGIDPALAGRLVAYGYFVALAAGAAVAGRRIGGRWAALAAVAVLLAFDPSAPPSPIQGPSDLLGEIPAAALLLWAAIAVRRRPWLAGLLLGLAVQAKTISLLAAPALVLAVLLLGSGPLRRRIRRVAVAAAAAIAPTALFELVALVTMGMPAYALRVRSMGSFLITGGQAYQGTSPVEKILVLADSWFVPPPLMIALVVVLAGFTLWAARNAWQNRRAFRVYARRAGLAPSGTIASQLVVGAVGLTTFVTWWAFASHTPLWVRHPAPGVFAFTPLLVAGVVLAVRWCRAGESPRASRLVGAAVGTVLALLISLQLSLHVASALSPTAQTLTAQREVAADVRDATDSPWIATPWGSGVSIGVLAGMHVGMTDGTQLTGVPTLAPAGNAPACEGRAVALDEWMLCLP
ncbi:glycosyltransferase 87 family protein [Microbacterium sp.]|uniref:glycosyltransferase 87 family protein n=1 Tax=Microbacterium sp. TaxID=51671 RepID=UPI0025FAA128|nr:glycosyltransferase 87 family protein [Microbacterium sp.]